MRAPVNLSRLRFDTASGRLVYEPRAGTTSTTLPWSTPSSSSLAGDVKSGVYSTYAAAFSRARSMSRSNRSSP